MISFIKKALKHLKNLRSIQNINPSYSQEGEDIILNRLLILKKDIEKGFYVDIGCFHPQKYSNTYLLHLKGWRGINIDANPLAIKKFIQSRPNDINLNVGIANEERLLKYFIFNHPALNTFSEKQAEEYLKNDSYKLIRTELIQVRKLKDILDSSVPKGEKITLLSIDIEGLDYDALISNDWNIYVPSVIVIENHTSDIEDIKDDKIYLFLNAKGYKLISKLDLSCIYVHKTFL